jgi:hypothetical protein
MHDNLIATGAHRMAQTSLDPRRTTHNNARQPSAPSSLKNKKGRDRQPEGGDSPKHLDSSLPNADSGVSLDYSLDSQHLLSGEEYRPSGVNGAAMLQYVAASHTTTRAAGTHVPPQNARRPVDQGQRQQPSVVTVKEEDDGLSLQESGSSEVIPTDEELFMVGWAKALDPTSGNYYYFTLDRTKTVWENPLSADTYVSAESSYFSGSGASSLHQTYQKQTSR